MWRGGKKTHASSPSTSGKTHEKTCPIQTRRETRDTSYEPLEIRFYYFQEVLNHGSCYLRILRVLFSFPGFLHLFLGLSSNRQAEP